MKYWVIAIIILLILGGVWLVYAITNDPSENAATSPTPTTTAQPNSTPTSSPAESTSPDPNGSPATSPNTDQEIILQSPQEDAEISSPLVITGQARGSWYFEGNFPVILTDWNGEIIADGVATAQGDWMTDDLVPFTAELEFETPADLAISDRGSLILQKANPSGLPANDDAREITIYFE